MNLMKFDALSRKVLALIIAVAIIATSVAVTLVSVATGEWDGSAATSFKEGAGTEDDPYLVSTPAELKLAVTSTGLNGDGAKNYYKMTGDIYLNPALSDDWVSNSPISWGTADLKTASADTAFAGVFDGDGYMVYGLYVNETYTAPEGTTADRSVAAGLFPTIAAGADIKNVGIDKAFLSLKNNHETDALAYAGQVGLVGYAYNSSAAKITIDRCFIGSDVTMKAVFAGLVGDLKSNTSASVVLTNCYAIPSTVETFNEPDKTYIYNNRFMLCAGRDNSAGYKFDYCYTFGNLTFTGSGSTDTKYNYCTSWAPAALGVSGMEKYQMQGDTAFESMPGLNTKDAYLLTASYPVLKVFDKETLNIWDGSASAPVEGSGTSNDPFIISEPSHLYYVIKNGGGENTYYKLVSDIYLNDLDMVDWSTGETFNGYTPRSWENNIAVQGNFDGDGYVVYGLYYNAKATPEWGHEGVGLFPRVNRGKSLCVSNLGVDKAYLNGKNCAGAFVGFAGSTWNGDTTEGVAETSFSCCYVGEDVTIYSGDAAAFRAGGYNCNTVIDNCYSLGNFTATNKQGLIGNIWSATGTISNSYNAKGSLTTEIWNKNIDIDNVYGISVENFPDDIIVRSPENMQGTDVFSNVDKMPLLNADAAFIPREGYPTLRCFDKSIEVTEAPWDGTEATPTAMDDKGNVIISTPEELAYVIKNGGGANYVLTNDIYINAVDQINWQTGAVTYGYAARQWYTSENTKAFSGSIDGQGHTVYGMYYALGTPATSYNTPAVALIPRVANSAVVIKNLGVDSAYVKATYNGAALIGHGSNTTVRKIDNCYVGENVTIIGFVAGGIFGGGDASLDITNCYSLATLGAAKQNGGILGGTWSYTYSGVATRQNVTNCYSTTSIHGNGAGVQTNCYGKVGENCKGQDAILNFKLGEPFCATKDSYPALRVFAGLEEGNWNGLGISTFKGSGTENDPYLVENAGQLAYLSYSNNDKAHYKQICDIFVNDVTDPDWYKNENLVSWLWINDYSGLAYRATGHQFGGTYDGNGYTVQGIWYPEDIKTQVAGIFLSSAGATIKNLGVRNSYLYAGYTKDWALENGYATSDNVADRAIGTVGAVLGWHHSGTTTVTGCFADETVYIHNYSNGNLSATGGVVGFVMSNGTTAPLNISDCWSSAQLSSPVSSKINGILGSAWAAYYTGKNNYSFSYPAFQVGNSITSKTENAYANNYSNTGSTNAAQTVLTSAQMMGTDAFDNMIGFSDDIWYAANNDQSGPLHRLYGTTIGDVNEDAAGRGSGDITALRSTLIGAAEFKNTDFNRDNTTDICDLVKMKNEHTPILTFDANGGTFGGTKTSVKSAQTIGNTFAVATPSRDKFNFVGWSLTPDGDIIDSNIVTAELDGATIYAVWSEFSLELSPVFKNNMILQRNKPVCVYGTGKGTGEITIGNQTKTVNSEGGTWEIYFEPIEASTTPVTFKTNLGGIEKSYSNVLVGDVFIASGQSNMEFNLKSTEQTGTVGENSLLRYSYRGTQGWYAFAPSVVESATAIGVLFAQELSYALDNSIPVGIISCSKGASRIDDWIHEDYCFCEEYDFENLAHSDYDYYDQGHHDLYRNQIEPIEKLTTAGVLWYQGESNRGIGEAYRYLDMFKIMVNSWRTRMDDPTLPFYTVQIMLYTGDSGKDRNGAAVDEYNIRIAQGEAARTMDGVTVCTMLSYDDTLDVNGALDIHPTDKLPVAKALANAALTTYYYPLGDYDKTPEYSGPLYDNITVNGATATITFSHIAEGLMLTTGDTVTELEVRDISGNWVAATGILSNNVVTVSADGVTAITGVRMGYRNRPSLNLYSTIGGVYGYCASPFVWTAE